MKMTKAGKYIEDQVLSSRWYMYVLGLKTSNRLPTSIWHSQMCQCHLYMCYGRFASIGMQVLPEQLQWYY
jgi:hypothetical protein